MLSYARGPDLPIREQTIDEALTENVSRLPDHEALVAPHQQARFTFRELDAAVQRTARGLAGLGLGAGDRVGVWAVNCVEWVLVQLACARTGTVLVNINPAYRLQDLGFVLRKSRMKALFLHPKDALADYQQILNEARQGQTLELRNVVYLGEDSWEQMLATGADLPPVNIRPTDVANIQYTSGTTGFPKGVLLTHRSILNNAWFFSQQMGLSEVDRMVNPFPLYHCGGCVAGSLAMVAAGFTLILPSFRFDARAVLSAVSAERATALGGVPTMFIAELECPAFSSFDLTSLRTGGMTGAPCPIELMRRVLTEMHIPQMRVNYGQTEASPVITMSRHDDGLERRVSTVGCAMPNTEIKVIDAHSGETLPVGEQGELCARGYLVMKGYDDDPAATARAIDSEGWLHTGDLGTMRPDHYIRITGRAKDLIIRGGENIFPAEVEGFLHTHPKIVDVQVVGIPDEKLGEVVAAWIRLRSGEVANAEEIRDFCQGKIAYFKVPQHIRFVDSFPMTATGKIQKFKIREIEIEERGLHKAAQVQTA